MTAQSSTPGLCAYLDAIDQAVADIDAAWTEYATTGTIVFANSDDTMQYDAKERIKKWSKAMRAALSSETALPPTSYGSAAVTPTAKPRRWADQYDFDKSDPATRLFVAASNWVDRCERAEEELARVKQERGVLALKLAGAECFIEEQRKKGNIK